MTTKEKIAVMEHFDRGGKVETKSNDKWYYIPNPLWDWSNNLYRIKSESAPLTKYVVGLKTGALMECPEIEYTNIKIIEAGNPEEAERLYNQKYKCEYHYAKVLGVVLPEQKPEVFSMMDWINKCLPKHQFMVAKVSYDKGIMVLINENVIVATCKEKALQAYKEKYSCDSEVIVRCL
jgi:hypothetical protein